MQLELSKPMPLTVTIDVPGLDSEEGENDGETVKLIDQSIMEKLQLLAPHSDRILFVDIQTPWDAAYLLEHLDFPLPRMQELICTAQETVLGLDDVDPHEISMALMLPSFGRCTPALRSITFTDVMGQSFIYFRNLTSINLHSLGVSRLEMAPFLDLLSRCPTLETLEIKDLHLGNRIPTVVTLPRLSELWVENVHDHLFFPSIRAPSLKSLTAWMQKSGVDFENVPDSDSRTIMHRITSLKIRNLLHPSSLIEIIGRSSSHTMHVKLAEHERLGHHLGQLARIPLLDCVQLEIDWAWPNPATSALTPVFSNCHAVRRIDFLQVDLCMDFLNVLTDSADLCPELETIVVPITRMRYRDVYFFDTVKDLVASRAALGKVVKVGHTLFFSEEEDDMSVAWNELCDRNSILRIDSCA